MADMIYCCNYYFRCPALSRLQVLIYKSTEIFPIRYSLLESDRHVHHILEIDIYICVYHINIGFIILIKLYSLCCRN